MPDRAIIPLATAFTGGFLGGLIASVLQMQRGAAILLGAVVALAAAAAGAASTVGASGVDADRRPVAGLRALLAAATAVLLYMGVVALLGSGNVLGGLLLLLLAGACALALTRIRIRNADEVERGEDDGDERVERRGTRPAGRPVTH